MIQAVLSNAQHPESGQVNVRFPIPREEYAQTIEALQTIDLGFCPDPIATETLKTRRSQARSSLRPDPLRLLTTYDRY